MGWGRCVIREWQMVVVVVLDVSLPVLLPMRHVLISRLFARSRSLRFLNPETLKLADDGEFSFNEINIQKLHISKKDSSKCRVVIRV